MNINNSSQYPVLLPNSLQINTTRQEFWNGTLVDNYNFLMSEELIYQCKKSLEEPFISLNDLAVHHVSFNEFEKQYVELSDWCQKISGIIKKVSSNTLICYLRQKYYEDLYEQGLMRLRMFNQYSNKLIERFPDLSNVIKNKIEIIYNIWSELEARFISYLDEDFDRIIQDLYSELVLFEEWIIAIEEQLAKFNAIRNENITSDDLQELMKLQNEIKSKNSRISSVIEICDRLKVDYKQQIDEIPFDYASDLENRWHQLWIHSVEFQCKLEERFKTVRQSASTISLIDDDDIIPFNSSEYEKISLTSSTNTSMDHVHSALINRKRLRSPDTSLQNSSRTLGCNRKVIKSKRRMSLNFLPHLLPSTLYYSLTNINEYNDKRLIKKQKKTSSKLDIGYASEDDSDKKPMSTIKKSQSDSTITAKSHSNFLSSLTQSLPLFEHLHLLPKWCRRSVTSAYDTCSSPDIDISIEDIKKTRTKPSLLMYSKKYTKLKKSLKQKFSSKANSYDASTEYTDPEQSENDVDLLPSNLVSSASAYNYQNSESLFYNRYTTTTTTTTTTATTTTTTGYSSDIEPETATITRILTEIPDQPLYSDETSHMNSQALRLPSSVTSNEHESLNTIISDKTESSEPCWDGYQSPLFYPLNSQDIDSIETTLKWDDQFFEIDQLCNTTSDDEIHFHDYCNRPAKNNNSSSLSLITTSVPNKQQFDSDSDLDDFNYVINESERQLFKTRQSLEKRKRQQQSFSISNDRSQRKYDEILRTCETNIQCLQKILKNIHRSKNFRLNNTDAVELLQKYLTDWHDMRQQVNDDRIRARHLLHLSQQIVKLGLRAEEELSHIKTSFNHTWFENNSLSQIKDLISYEIDLENQNRQKLNSLYTDLDLAEEHLREYHMAYSNVSSSFNIDDHLNSTRLSLEQFTNKLDSYRTQLRTLLTMIDNLLPIENRIEQKLTSIDYTVELQDLQALIDDYERMIPMNNAYLIIKNHCEYKLDIYRKMLNDLIHKQDQHVSFENPINFNNNNSTNINLSTSQKQYKNTADDNMRKKKMIFNQYKQTDTQDMQSNCTTNKKSKTQSTTSSYISDDCKVLYIETVIEVAKPVFYEHTTDTSSTTNTEYYHHHIPNNRINTEQILTSNRNKFILNRSNKTPEDDSSDNDLHGMNGKPVNSQKKRDRQQKSKDHLTQELDSAIELDQTSSSSTLYKQNMPKDRLLFPPSNGKYNETSQPSTLVRRLQKQTPLNYDNILTKQNKLLPTVKTLKRSNTCWDRFKQSWLRALLIGLFILFILFLTYLLGLDTCSRSAIIKTICQKFIHIENEGLPTF